MIMEKQNKKNGTFGRLLRYIYKNYRVYMITVIICIIIAAAASVVQTVFLQQLIDTCILPGLENGFESIRQPFMQTILSMVTLYVFGVAAAFTYTHLMATVTQGTLKHLRVDMFDKMQSLPIKYFDTHAHGDIMSTYTNDTDAIRQLIGQSLPMVFQSSLTITVMFLMMIYYSVWMTLVVCLFSALMLTVTKKFGGASSRYMMAQQRSLAKEEGFIEEMIQGQKVVKVFCHEDECKKDFDKLNEQLFSDGEQANRYGNSLMPILNNVGNLMYVVLAIVGGLLVYLKAPNLSLSGSGVVTIGVIVSFLGMARQLSQTIGQASMQVAMIAMGLAGASRVFALIDEKPEEDEGYVTLVRAEWGADGVLKETNDKSGIWAWKHPHKADGTVTYTPLKGDIRLEDVDFGYTPEKLVLHDITLYAKPGQKIAFVGATGAGKTTITNLINRFYEIDSGEILMDGVDIRKVGRENLRSNIAMVLQDTHLFTGTIRENIRYGRLDATDAEVEQAAKMASAHSFIMRLENGYDTMIEGDGANLSQGQRQLLNIARAAISKAPVLILDEATSSVDTRTERHIEHGMDRLMADRTTLVIAHRLSTVRNANAIMVLENGEIIERGDHDQLLEQKGRYYELYTGKKQLA